MTAGTSGDTSGLNIEEMGLSPAHAYTFHRHTVPWLSGQYHGAGGCCVYACSFPYPL